MPYPLVMFGTGDALLTLTTMSSGNTDPSTTATPPTAIKKASSTRPPSLNQLAARLNSNAAAANGGTAPLQPPVVSAPRPRLAAFALRTGSNASLSTNDSMAVNAPSTRSATPSGASTTSLPTRSTPVNDNGGEPLTTEKLDELNQETAAAAAGATKTPETLSKIADLPKKKVGYKNIPSLDAITARLAKARSLSVDGSAMPPEPKMIEDPKTPGLVMKAPEHPLQFSWCVDCLVFCRRSNTDAPILNVGLYITIQRESSLIHPLAVLH